MNIRVANVNIRVADVNIRVANVYAKVCAKAKTTYHFVILSTAKDLVPLLLLKLAIINCLILAKATKRG